VQVDNRIPGDCGTKGFQAEMFAVLLLDRSGRGV
jgi:hypothetical protein